MNDKEENEWIPGSRGAVATQTSALEAGPQDGTTPAPSSGVPGKQDPARGLAPPGTHHGDVQLAERFAIEEVGACVGDILGVALGSLWGDVAEDLPLLLNLLPDLQVFKVRVGSITVVGLDVIQLDGIHDGGQSLLDHLPRLLCGRVHLLLQLLAGALEAAFARVLGLGVLLLGATALRSGSGGGGRGGLLL